MAIVCPTAGIVVPFYSTGRPANENSNPFAHGSRLASLHGRSSCRPGRATYSVALQASGLPFDCDLRPFAGRRWTDSDYFGRIVTHTWAWGSGQIFS